MGRTLEIFGVPKAPPPDVHRETTRDLPAVAKPVRHVSVIHDDADGEETPLTPKRHRTRGHIASRPASTLFNFSLHDVVLYAALAGIIGFIFGRIIPPIF